MCAGLSGRGPLLPVWLTLAVSGAVLLCSTTVPAQTRQTLHGHVPAALAHLPAIGRAPAATRVHLAIGLPVRNQPALTQLLQELYDPASPNYRHYLTPEQFAARFGPAEQDYQAVVAFAETNGFTVTARHPNRLVLDVAGTVGVIEKTLHVTMRTYRHPTEARTFYAPDTEPAVDCAVPLLHIIGLDNFARPRPRSQPRPAALAPQSGSAPGGGYMGNDFRAAYVPGTALTGAGQSVGLLQYDGYYASDITAYETKAGLPAVTLTNIPINGGVSTPGGNNVEVCLDIEMVISMAPGLSRIIVYEAPNDNSTSWATILSRMANDNAAKQLSCSWGGGSPDALSEQIFQQMAAQGQSFFNATGDANSFCGAIEFPSDSTNIVQVGGTTLTTTGAGGSYVSETVWRWNSSQGSSGGSSTYYPIPAYQLGLDMTANHGSTTMRNVPDVALTGDNVYVVYNNGGSGNFGGTSCAAPLWAGFTALVNQQAATNGLAPVGFLNPALYTIGKAANYTACFHDTTSGNNDSSCDTTNFPAVTGYDLCTGWGTPTGTNLINVLAIPGNPTPVITAAGATLLGESCLPTNGAIDPGATVTVNFTLQNVGTGSTTNLVATLLATNGVTAPSAPQTYGAIVAGGGMATQPFSFTATGTCGSNLTATLQLQDGTINRGTAAFNLQLGQLTVVTNPGQEFDGVTAPALPAGWTTSASGAQSSWITATTSNSTPPNAAFSPDPASVGINELDSPALIIGATVPRLSFRHNYNLEAPSSGSTGYDGGVLEIKIASGSYTDIVSAGGSFIANGYTRTISSAFSNPLSNRLVWSGTSGGFITTIVTLPATVTGQTIQLRWRCGTDNSVSSTGWYIDSILITNSTYACCDSTANIAVGLTASPNPVLARQSLTYNLTATNLGPGVAGSVIVTDALPAAVTFTAATLTQGAWTNAGGNLICNFGTLAAGASATALISVTPQNPASATGTVVNTATLAPRPADPYTANNTASLTTTVYADTVGDSIPDWWRQQYFGGTGQITNARSTAGSDPDGDGFTNLQEYRAGTDPTNATSALRITQAAPSGNDFIIQFNTVAGKIYAIEWQTDLTSTNAWTSLATNITGTGTSIQVTDPGAAVQPRRFYRIRVQ